MKGAHFWVPQRKTLILGHMRLKLWLWWSNGKRNIINPTKLCENLGSSLGSDHDLTTHHVVFVACRWASAASKCDVFIINVV